MASRSEGTRSRTRSWTPNPTKIALVSSRLHDSQVTGSAVKRFKIHRLKFTDKDTKETNTLHTTRNQLIKSSTRSNSSPKLIPSPKSSTSPKSTSPRAQSKTERPEGTRLGIFEKLEKIRQDSPNRDPEAEVLGTAVAFSVKAPEVAGIYDRKLQIMKQALETSLLGSDVESDGEKGQRKLSQTSPNESHAKAKRYTCDSTRTTSRGLVNKLRSLRQQSTSPQQSDNCDEGDEFTNRQSIKKLRNGPSCAPDPSDPVIRGVSKVKDYVAGTRKCVENKLITAEDETSQEDVESYLENIENESEITKNNHEGDKHRSAMSAKITTNDESQADNVEHATRIEEISSEAIAKNTEIKENSLENLEERNVDIGNWNEDVENVDNVSTTVLESVRNSESNDAYSIATSTSCVGRDNFVLEAARSVQVYTSVSSVLQTLPKGDQKQPVICLPKVNLQPTESRIVNAIESPYTADGLWETADCAGVYKPIDVPKEFTERSAFSTARAICEAHFDNPCKTAKGTCKRIVRSKSLEENGTTALSLGDKMDSLIDTCLQEQKASSTDRNSDSARTSPRARKKTSIIEDYLTLKKGKPSQVSLKIAEDTVNESACKGRTRRAHMPLWNATTSAIAANDNIEEEHEENSEVDLAKKLTTRSLQVGCDIGERNEDQCKEFVISPASKQKQISFKADEFTLENVNIEVTSDTSADKTLYSFTATKGIPSANTHIHTTQFAEQSAARPVSKREIQRARGRVAPEVNALVQGIDIDLVFAGTASEFGCEVMDAVNDLAIDVIYAGTSDMSALEKAQMASNQLRTDALQEASNVSQNCDAFHVSRRTLDVKPRKGRPKSFPEMKPAMAVSPRTSPNTSCKVVVSPKTSPNTSCKSTKQELEEAKLNEDAVAESMMIQSPVRSRSGRAIKLTSAAIEAGLAHESSMSFLVGSTGSKERFKTARCLDFSPERACSSRETSPEKAHTSVECKWKKRGRKAILAGAGSALSAPSLFESIIAPEPTMAMLKTVPTITSILNNGVSHIPTASINAHLARAPTRRRSPPKKTIREILNITEEDLNVDMPPLARTGLSGRVTLEDGPSNVKESQSEVPLLLPNIGNVPNEDREKDSLKSLSTMSTEESIDGNALCKEEEKDNILPICAKAEDEASTGDIGSRLQESDAVVIQPKPKAAVSVREQEIDEMIKRDTPVCSQEEDAKDTLATNGDVTVQLLEADSKKNHTLFSLISQVTGSMNPESTNLPPIERPPSGEEDEDEELPLLRPAEQDSSEGESEKCSNKGDDGPEKESNEASTNDEEQESGSDSEESDSDEEEESSSSDVEKETEISEYLEASTQGGEEKVKAATNEDKESLDASEKVKEDSELNASDRIEDTKGPVKTKLSGESEKDKDIKSDVGANSEEGADDKSIGNKDKEPAEDTVGDEEQLVEAFQTAQSENSKCDMAEGGVVGDTNVTHGEDKLAEKVTVGGKGSGGNEDVMSETAVGIDNAESGDQVNQEKDVDTNKMFDKTIRLNEHESIEPHMQPAPSSSIEASSEISTVGQVTSDHASSLEDDPLLETPEERLMILEQQLKQLDNFLSENRIQTKQKSPKREVKMETNEYKADLSGLKMEDDLGLGPDVKIKVEPLELTSDSEDVKPLVAALSSLSPMPDKPSTSEENLHMLFEKPGPANKKKASAFFSNELDDYLTKNCKLSQKYKRFKQPCPKPTETGQTKCIAPDVDLVDDLVFYSFSSQDALEEYVKNGDRSLSPTSIAPNIALKMPKLEPSIGVAASSAMEEHKTPEKTDDVTKIKGWKNKFSHGNELFQRMDPPRLSPGGPVGPTVSPTPEGAINSMLKIHWRTKERLLRNLAPEEINALGLSLKRRRRKSKQLTYRKGTKHRHPSGDASGEHFEGRMRPPIMRPKKRLRPMVLTPSMVMSAMSALKFNKAKGLRNPADTCSESICRWGCICYLSDTSEVVYVDSDEASMSSSYEGQIPALAPCGNEYCRLGCICKLIDEAAAEGKPLVLGARLHNATRRNARANVNVDPDWDYNERGPLKQQAKPCKKRKLTFDEDKLCDIILPLDGGAELENIKIDVVYAGTEPASPMTSEMPAVKSSSTSEEQLEAVDPEPAQPDPAQGSYLSMFGLAKKSQISVAVGDGDLKEAAKVRKSSRLKDRTGIGHIDKLKDLMYFDVTKWEDGAFTGRRKKMRKGKGLMKEGKPYLSRGYITPSPKLPLYADQHPRSPLRRPLSPDPADTNMEMCWGMGLGNQPTQFKAPKLEGGSQRLIETSMSDLLRLPRASLAGPDISGKLPGQHEEQPIAISDDDDVCSDETLVSARTTVYTGLHRQRHTLPTNLSDATKSADGPKETAPTKSPFEKVVAGAHGVQQRPAQEEKRSGESSSSSSSSSRNSSMRIRKQMVLLARNHAARRSDKIEFKPELDDRQPHLLEIQSDCNWQPIRSHLLNQISIIADRDDLPPTGHKLCRRIAAFIVEIRPPADQSTPLPLNLQTSICRSLPAIRIMITQEVRKPASVRGASGERAQIARPAPRPPPPPYSHPHNVIRNRSPVDTSVRALGQPGNIPKLTSNQVLLPTDQLTPPTPPYSDAPLSPVIGMSALSRLNINAPGCVQQGRGSVSVQNRLAPSNFTHYENLSGHLPGRLHTAKGQPQGVRLSTERIDSPKDETSTGEKLPHKPPQHTISSISGLDIQSLSDALRFPAMNSAKHKRSNCESTSPIKSTSACWNPKAAVYEKTTDMTCDTGVTTTDVFSVHTLHGVDARIPKDTTTETNCGNATTVTATADKGCEHSHVLMQHAGKWNTETGKMQPAETDTECSSENIKQMAKDNIDSAGHRETLSTDTDYRNVTLCPIRCSSSDTVVSYIPPGMSRGVGCGPRVRFPGPGQPFYGQGPVPPMRRGPGPRVRLPTMLHGAGPRLASFIAHRPRIRIPLSAINMSQCGAGGKPITVNLSASSATVPTMQPAAASTMMVAPMAARVPMLAEQAITKVAGGKVLTDTPAAGNPALHPDWSSPESTATDCPRDDTAQKPPGASPALGIIGKDTHPTVNPRVMTAQSLFENAGDVPSKSVYDKAQADNAVAARDNSELHNTTFGTQMGKAKGTIMLGPLSDNEDVVTDNAKVETAGDNTPATKPRTTEVTASNQNTAPPSTSTNKKHIPVVIVSDDSDEDNTDIDVTSPEDGPQPAACELRDNRDAKREDGLQLWLQKLAQEKSLNDNNLQVIEPRQEEDERMRILKRDGQIAEIRQRMAAKKIECIIAEKKEQMAADRRDRITFEKRYHVLPKRPRVDGDGTGRDSNTHDSNGRNHIAKAEHIARERLRRLEIARKFSRLRAAIGSTNYKDNLVLDPNMPIKESSKQAVLLSATRCILYQRKQARRLEKHRAELLEQRVLLINRLKALKYPMRLASSNPPQLTAVDPTTITNQQQPTAIKRVKGQWGPASKRACLSERPTAEPDLPPTPKTQTESTFTITAVRSLADTPNEKTDGMPVSVSSSDGDVEAEPSAERLLSGADDDSNDYLSSRSHSTNNDD